MSMPLEHVVPPEYDRPQLAGSPPPRMRAVEPLHPDPPPPPKDRWLQRLALSAYEAIDGIRHVSQLGASITSEVAEHLAARRAVRTERRSLYKDHRRSVPVPGAVHRSEPVAGVVEVAIVFTDLLHSFVVAMRVEYLQTRWRATRIVVL